MRAVVVYESMYGNTHQIAEAIGACAALAAATGEAEFAVRYQELWDHAAVFFFDLERGSWHHELDEANHPSASVWAGKPDIYHALQTTLIPRLPLAPALSVALRDGLLDHGWAGPSEAAS